MNIGVVSEGQTDQVVLEAIIKGVLGDRDADLSIHQVQPPVATPGEQSFGGWNQLFVWLKGDECRKALQLNDIVVIHVDTDVCDKEGFDVFKQEAGRRLADLELVARVRARLEELMDARLVAEHSNRLVFAIAVDEIECWLLPLFITGDKARKNTGCFNELREILQRLNRGGLKKDPREYRPIAKDFRKRKHVDKARTFSESLNLFVAELERKASPPPAAPDQAPAGP